MDPKEFSWKEDQQVTVTNPTKDNYQFKVHYKDYEVKAGETVRMPGYIAWLYVYGLASQICQRENKFNRWNEEGFRKTYFDRLVVGADDVIEKVVVEPSVEPVDLGSPESDDELDESTLQEAEKEPQQRKRRGHKDRR